VTVMASVATQGSDLGHAGPGDRGFRRNNATVQRPIPSPRQAIRPSLELGAGASGPTWQKQESMCVTISGLVIRRATLEDVPAIRVLLAAHDNDSPVTSVDIVGPYVRHLIRHAIALVTERDRELVAYGAAVDTGIARHLADLFVRADLLGRGIGRPLLASVMGDAPQRTTFASADPRAIPLYVRAGMAPLWPSFYLEGTAAALRAPGPSIRIEPADPARLASLERAWTGHDRSTDHLFWASQAEAEGFVVLDAGEATAFGYARARQVGVARTLDRLLVRPDGEPVRPTVAAIRHAGRGGAVMANVAGPSAVLPALLAAGFKITDHDQFMASDPGLVDPARLIPNSGML
jgi:GNAT superfamily N-acetyltransferase